MTKKLRKKNKVGDHFMISINVINMEDKINHGRQEKEIFKTNSGTY